MSYFDVFSSTVIVVCLLSPSGGYSLFIVAPQPKTLIIILVIDLRLFSPNFEINKTSLEQGANDEQER